MPRKHTTMITMQRIELCRYAANNKEQTQHQLIKQLQETYGITVSQPAISATLNASTKWLQDDTTGFVTHKRQKLVKYPPVEQALGEWFRANQEVLSMSGDLLQEKGAIFFQRIYPDAEKAFEFSNGWLEQFKKRHGIKSFRRFGESGSVNAIALENALPAIRQKLDQYALVDIYNMDETGLFYRMQADNSLATMQLEGKKQSKERVTITICCNADGSHCLPLAMIGKSIKPRCFKNIDINSIGIRYHANKNAWMTQNIFNIWLRSKNGKSESPLILDNCSALTKPTTPGFPVLANTEILFLPPNTTSKIQPCDAGIIRTFKAYYRKRFNRKPLANIEDQIHQPEKVSLLDAIQMEIAAWETDMRKETLANCFRHCSIRTFQGEASASELSVGPEPTIINELQEQIRLLHYRNPMSVENLLNYPSENVVAQVITDDSIVEEILHQNQILSNEEDEDSPEIPKITRKEAEKMADGLELCLMQQGG